MVSRWENLIKTFGNEVNVLIDAELSEIEKVTDTSITSAIEAFRKNEIIFYPGGGGEYGKFEILKNYKSKNEIINNEKQKSLFNF